MNASANVRRSVANGGRTTGGSAKRQRKPRDMRNPWRRTGTKLKKNQRLRSECIALK